MDKYFTIMIIPERGKNVHSFRIPRILFRSLSVIFALSLLTLLVFAYDYKQVMDQVYENKHLAIENRQLREQLNVFQIKINNLADELNRIYTFEKKLRIITGIEQKDLPTEGNSSDTSNPSNPSNPSSLKNLELDTDQEITGPTTNVTPQGQNLHQHKVNLPNFNFQVIEKDPEYIRLKNLYDLKIAGAFGLEKSYIFTKEWSTLLKQSFSLALNFAELDYKYSKVKGFTEKLELEIHEIDQFLLDRESFLKSIPTILPSKGWITSYYGPRQSPYSGRLKMHEGLDIGARPGSYIMATADGIVTYAGHKSGFGKFVQINHGYGIETLFGHAQSLNVRPGQKVKRGELVAQVGSTGLSTGPHVHYEVRVNGIAVDPLYYILD